MGGSTVNARIGNVGTGGAAVRLLFAAGLGLLPWIVLLAATDRGAAPWVVLDLAEAACLLGAGWMLRTARPHHRALAAGAALLLTADACCDLATSAPGQDLLVALAMALLVELPLAAFCTRLALRRAPSAAPAAAAGARLRRTGVALAA
jgi:hypothetical protein